MVSIAARETWVTKENRENFHPVKEFIEKSQKGMEVHPGDAEEPDKCPSVWPGFSVSCWQEED